MVVYRVGAGGASVSVHGDVYTPLYKDTVICQLILAVTSSTRLTLRRSLRRDPSPCPVR